MSQKNATNSIDYEERLSWAQSPAIHWDQLENEYRTVILAEAGSGKTIEIQQAARRLRLSGKSAFFIRLEYISDGLEYAFDSDDTGSFEEFADICAGCLVITSRTTIRQLPLLLGFLRSWRQSHCGTLPLHPQKRS